jgi:hypothetical protein
MNLRPAAALALAVPALALGGAACGSGGATKTSAQEQHRAEQHWRAGLLRWSHSMQGALNGLSIIFSSQGSLDRIRRAGSPASASLATYELTMVRCTRKVRGLGPVPEVFAMAGRYAMRACASLERGERAVEVVVEALRRGNGFDTLDPLDGAGDLLSAGQAQVTTAVRALDTTSSA